MFKFVRLATKNVFRNRRRTIITGLVLIFGTSALILAGGFVSFSFRGLSESTIKGQLGHIQLYTKEALQREEEKPLELGLDSVDALKRTILGLDHVRFAMARVEFTGLISNGDKSAVFLGRGVEPEKETKLAGYALAVDTGKFLGENPGNTEESEVVLARGLAKTMKAKIGDYLTLMTTTSKGALNAMDVKVVGTYSTGIPEYDERALMVDLKTAQQLLVSQKVSKLVVVLDETDKTEEVASRIEKLLPGITARRWFDMATFYNAVVHLYNSIFGFLGVIIFVIVVLSCSNTMMMSIFERTKEIGTQLAVGTSPLRLMINFLYEGVIVGASGGAVGLVVALLLALLINALGIHMPAPPGSTRGYPLIVDLVPSLFIVVFFLITITTVISTIFPAYKASRLKIVDALGHV
ncbi:MAG TPA: FtsX-like permease family protein [Bacteroidota bacterium]|nr:FtsX-like permease family protein [Bacteroidota bacterium]